MDILRELNLDLFENLNLLFEIYKEWEEYFSFLKREFLINCPDFCSFCCNTDVENIQSTIFEMLPSAILFYKLIFENGKNKEFLEIQKIDISILNKVKEELFYERYYDKCIFYREDIKNDWGCSIYSIRPSICRLFGFSFKKDKRERLIFTPCKKLGRKIITIQKYEKNNKIPIYNNLYFQIFSINLNYSNKFYNINLAFKKAFEIVYLKFKIIK
ncbi:MAG: YkgJ family cysteine cluster protein [Exilispira sp.]